MYLHGTSCTNEAGHLEIGGVDTVRLAKEYGTPLFVYDEAYIRNRSREFMSAFREKSMRAQVAYASKAFNTIAMCQLAHEEGLSLDVVSGGELYTALSASFPPERIHFHGNNKTPEELEMALQAGIGCYVVDNFDELDLLQQIAEVKEQKVRLLLRVSPGIEAHTHEYIATGQEDSKFGFDLASGQVHEALAKALQCPHCEVLGLHAHIGSQIFDTEAFELTIRKLASFLDEVEQQSDWDLSVLNVGGGFGIRYTEEDTPLDPRRYVHIICDTVQGVWSTRGKPVPEIWIEPGRSIVGEAGTTLYTIGAQKEVPGIRSYISVDGGMSDNIRVALYQARYEAALANRMYEQAKGSKKTYTIAGKLCETGDILLKDVELPEVRKGDLLAMSCTGAYGYSMASNYNRMRKPAVVFVRNKETHLVVKRETNDDLIRNDIALKSKATL